MHATTSSVECVGVRVCVPKCTTSTGLAGQPNYAWMAAARCLDGTSSVVCVGVGVCAGLAGQLNGAWMLVAVSPPPGTPFSVRWQGPDTAVCVGRTLTSVRSKKYMEQLCNRFLTSMVQITSASS